MNDDVFCQRPKYRSHTSTSQLRKLAQTQSREGQYNLVTLWAFRRVWRRSQKGSDYLAYVLFRRALGYGLTQAKADVLIKLLEMPLPLLFWHKLYGHRRRQINNLLAEYHYHQHMQVVTPAVLPAFQEMVLYWRRQQQLWQHELTLKLQQAKRIQLVGNSPALSGSALGNSIDSADVVVRFNRFQSENTKIADSGSKLDIWVMAPDFQKTLPAKLDWCLVSGPDIVWQQQRWPQFSTQSPRKLLSIPLLYWRQLVRQLAAPPSAGLLVAYFLRSTTKSNKIQLAGFGYNPDTVNYHYTSPTHKAASRHNWAGELNIIQQWQLSCSSTGSGSDE
jgi:hypothetical protein